jgi:hypothetical protein
MMKRSGRSFSSEELRHAPEKVWQAVTDPPHLRVLREYVFVYHNGGDLTMPVGRSVAL